MRLIDADAAYDILTAYYHQRTEIQRKALREALDRVPTAESCEDEEFWRKRAEYYSKMCLDLIADMNNGVKIDSIEINEDGIKFTKKQPEPQWIPCSERLPETSGTYLVSGMWASGRVAVGDCEYSIYDGYFNTAWNFDVLAWMPLPEPYREEGTE